MLFHIYLLPSPLLLYFQGYYLITFSLFPTLLTSFPLPSSSPSRPCRSCCRSLLLRFLLSSASTSSSASCLCLPPSGRSSLSRSSSLPSANCREGGKRKQEVIMDCRAYVSCGKQKVRIREINFSLPPSPPSPPPLTKVAQTNHPTPPGSHPPTTRGTAQRSTHQTARPYSLYSTN